MDEIIEKVGNFGPFQATLFVAMSCSLSVCGFGLVFMMYGMYNPGWTCGDNSTLGGDGDSNLTLPLDYTSETPTHYNVTSTSQDICDLWRQCSNVVFDTSSSTIVTEWNLLCDNSWKASMIITVQMAGVLLGSWVCGPVGDRFGRRISLYFNTVISLVAHLITAFSLSLEMFAALRFVIGFGLGGVVSIAQVYPLEFVGDWWRPVLLSIPVWSLGVSEMAVVSYILKDWRHIHIAGASLCFISLLPVFWVPESTRWLAVHGQVEKVKVVIRRMASWNRKPHVDDELINETVRNIVESQRKTAKPNYLDLFRTKRLRVYSIKFGVMWVIIASVYYMITFGVRSISGDFYTNMILFTVIEVPFYLFVGPFSNKLGRRLSTCLFLALAGLTSFGNVAVYFLPGPWTAIASTVMVTVSKGAVMAAWNVLAVFSAELYPTIVRNLQSGYLNCVCRFGAMISGYTIPAEENKVFISFLIAGSLLLLCAGIVLSVSDSRGRRMADTIEEITIKGKWKERENVLIEDCGDVLLKDSNPKQDSAHKEEADGMDWADLCGKEQNIRVTEYTIDKM